MPRLEFQFRTLEKWPRLETPAKDRKGAYVFKSDIPKTLKLLAHELHAVGAINPVLVTTAHSEKHVRIDGLPRADVPTPKFPGVIIEFMARPGRLLFACDTCVKWEHNLHAIALTMEWLRAVDRYGAAGGGDAQYAGFRALPAPGASNPTMSVEQAASFIAAEGSPASAQQIITSQEYFRSIYRKAAGKLHPDRKETHDPAKWAQLQQANEILQDHHGRAR